MTKFKPWFAKHQNINSSKKVIIIGGGISGAATAYSLATRGYQVIIYEKNSASALEASGNSQAILYANYNGNYTPLTELSFAGFSYSHDLITALLQKDIDYQICGLIQLTKDKDTADKWLKSTLANLIVATQNSKTLNQPLWTDFCNYVNRDEINQIANTDVACNHGLYFTEGLWLKPRSLVHKLTQHPNIQIVLNSNISNIKLNEASKVAEYAWSIANESGIIDQAPNLVLCNSHAIKQYSQTNKIHLRMTRGQNTQVKSNLNLSTILCGNGYITPNAEESFTLGATFKPNSHDLTVKDEEHAENINNVAIFLPQLAEHINSDKISGHAAIRCGSNDYLPLVGPIADYAKFKNAYSALAKDANYVIGTPCPYLPGIFINVAHGSKGMLTAPISGEIIADYIDNSTNACNEILRQALHPNRFWLKEIIYSTST